MPLTDLVPDPGAVERIATGSTWAEGPVWIPATRTLRWSDIPGDRIMQWHADDGTTSVYADRVEFTNGRTLDRDGSVVQCSHGRRRVERDRDGVVEPIVASWDGVRFNSPNDVVVAPDGTIWFTDPDYGITQSREGHAGYLEYGDHAVFRFDPATGRVRPVVLDVEEPNGLAFSPDGTTLYVADSSASEGSDVGNRWIRAYDVVDGIRCNNGRVFAQFAVDEGVPDGIRVDEDGNVWSSSAQGVIVVAPSGDRIGTVPVPEVVANLCFGGDDGTTLFIAATTSIYRVATTARDAHGIALRR
ncbi:MULTISPECIES: SMP-30/gluconolactonase/LRE family protein [unclassified Curtobacterium]|uniref:SMP-30/gluconolactonase/LRE family protein n=1 Tax=unclassified Curtobacterium TaxID=257496 RepID=UPI0026D28EDD